MFPNTTFPLYTNAPKPDITQEQLLLTLLSIKSQQNRFNSLFGQQPLKLNLIAQNQVNQNPFQMSLNPTTPSGPLTLRPNMLAPGIERINPFKAQIQPTQLDYQLLRNLTPTSFAYRMPFAAQEQTERSVPAPKSESESTQDTPESAFKAKTGVKDLVVKREEQQAETDEAASKHSGLQADKVSASKKIRKTEKAVNTCGHPERKHYAKGLCNNCYHKFGRVGKPELCEHDVIYAKGLCQKCYLVKYNQQKSQMMKRKKKKTNKSN